MPPDKLNNPGKMRCHRSVSWKATERRYRLSTARGEGIWTPASEVQPAQNVPAARRVSNCNASEAR
jgi:hypothetical protein